MSEDTLFELFISVGQKIDSLWEFYVTVHLAILGGILWVHARLHALISFTLFLSYLMFAWLNYGAIADYYHILTALQQDISSSSGPVHLQALHKQISVLDYSSREIILAIVYLASIAMMFFALITMSVRYHKK